MLFLVFVYLHSSKKPVHSPRPKKPNLFKAKIENNVIKDKKTEENIIKNVDSLFRLRKENKISNIRFIFKSEEDYYDPARNSDAYYAEYVTNDDRNIISLLKII